MLRREEIVFEYQEVCILSRSDGALFVLYAELYSAVDGIPDNLKTYNHVLLYSMAVHHLQKREKVLGRAYALPIDYNEAEDIEVFDCQTRMLAEENSCYVLNTSILLLVAYAPNRFLREIKTHPNSFYI